MSIIDNALKKTQQALDKKGKKDLSVNYERLHTSYRPPPINIDPDEDLPVQNLKPNSKKIFPASFLFILTFILSIAAAYLVYPLFYIKKSISYTLSPPPTKEKINTPNLPKHERAQNTVVLNGIMSKGDKNVALINDDIYEAGEFVQGREIIQITRDTVQLKEDNKLITLTVRKKK